MGTTRICFLMLFGVMIALTGCDHATNKAIATATVAPKAPVLMQPFRFHKLIEVAPGNDFDILSWGRGSSETGSFIILHSDSSEMKYATTTGDLEGTIVDVFNSDMDVDGNPEILIQAKTTDTNAYTKIYAFEFNGSRADKLEFPRLTKSQRKGYRGGDNFYIKEGKLMRSFPIYDGSGKEAKATGDKRLIEYGLRNNEFTAHQVSTDSSKINGDDKPAETTTVKKVSSHQTENKTQERHTKKHQSSKHTKKHKKHTTSHKKTKKRKRHHHSEE